MNAGPREPAEEAAAAIVEAVASDGWIWITEPAVEILGHGDWQQRRVLLDDLRATREDLALAARPDQARMARAAWAERISLLQVDGTVTAEEVRQLATSLRQRLLTEHPPEPPDWGPSRGWSPDRSPQSPGGGGPPAPEPDPWHEYERGGPPGTTFGDDDDDD